MKLNETSPLFLAFFSAYVFLLIIVLIIFTIYFIINKRKLNAILAISSFVVLFSIFQIIYIFQKNLVKHFLYQLSAIPIIVYLLAIILITGLIIYLAIDLFSYNHSHITSSSIIEAFDALLLGVLYFDEDGIPLLINNKMLDIVNLLDIKDNYNSDNFMALIDDKILTLNNKETYHFSINKICINRKYNYFSRKKYPAYIYEVVAKNITEMHKKTILLKAENERIIKSNQLLKKYHEQMPEIIRHQEILKAKISIHEEMNELLLSTVYLVDNENISLRKALLNKWQNNALLLSKENENSVNKDMINDLKTLSNSLGINIEFAHIDDIKPLGIRKLFITVGKETILNVAKYTGDKKLVINVFNKGEHYEMSFANPQKNKQKSIVYGSGLTNIKRHVEELNGKMVIINDDDFIVKLEV